MVETKQAACVIQEKQRGIALLLHHQLVALIDILRGDAAGSLADALSLTVIGEAGAAYRRKSSAIAPYQGAVACPVGRNSVVAVGVIGVSREPSP